MRGRKRHGTAADATARRLVSALVFVAMTALALAVLPAQPAAAAAAFDVPASDFVAGSAVSFSGTKDAGSTLVIRRADNVVCTVSDADALDWQCSSVSVPSGVHEFTGDETLADASVVPMTPLTLRVLAAPALEGASGSVITAGRFTGTAQPEASIQLQSTGSNGTVDHPCPAALPDGYWSCVVDLDGGAYQVRARQSSPEIGPEFSNYSPSVDAIIDRTAPRIPTITAPRSGPTYLHNVTARGVGERDALMQVFIDGTLACETIVSSSGSWSCPLRWPGAGTYRVQALQRDAAGNFSGSSARVDVRFAPAAPAPTPETGGEPSPPVTPETGSRPAPTPSTPGVTDAPPPNPLAPERPAGVTWGTATGFGSSLPTAEQVVQRGGWAVAPLVGLAYLLLAALPLRTFATHVLPRVRRPTVALTGRNREPDVDRDDTVPGTALSPLLIATGTLGGAAVIAALSGGIDLEVRYVRLTAAIGLGLLLLNVVAVLLPARLASRVMRTPVSVRLLPGILFAALVAALVSRWVELQPPLLVGVLITASAAFGARRRARAGVAVAQSSGVAALALIGWAAHDLLTPSTGFWMTLASETAAAVALGGLGSLLMLLLPVGPLPGRTLYAVSPPAWAVVALVSATVAGAIFVAGPAFPIVELVLAGAAFSAVLTAAVVWTRWVVPSWR